ncbi:MAG: HNH endonuclease [Dehalococcoidia bacterium]|nr:HNH endonuclease [Dehalococcoidia bacterium]
MANLAEVLEKLPIQHQNALRWFHAHVGTDQAWPTPLVDGTLLASKAKGIYKPQWSKYALSVRQSLNGPYPDKNPETLPDGSWAYSYFQENSDPSKRDSQYTNRGLVECLQDRVPVGVLRQVSETPKVLYRVLGLALVAGWEDGYFFPEGISPSGEIHGLSSQSGADALMSHQEQLASSLGAFEPDSIVEGRERVLASIVRRRGQPEFRLGLLSAYRGRCAITGCDAVEVLEAAHIVSYKGPETNHPANGLLLRADIHTLFDLGHIAIDSGTMTVVVSSNLESTSYADLKGKPLRLPKDERLHPSKAAFDRHRARVGL